MPNDLGDVIPLSINIYDSNGNLANATVVNLKVVKPDGTTDDLGTITPTTTGVYSFDYQPATAGSYDVLWTATGSNASAFADSFYINPTARPDFISLSQFKNHIRKTTTSDDESLRTFISAACRVINDRVGQVKPITVVEDVDSNWEGWACLTTRPIISVTSVITLPGSVTVAPFVPTTGLGIWYLSPGLTSIYTGTGRFRVTYRAGRSVIPENFILAALELTKHMWQTSQQNPGGGRPSVGVDETVLGGTSYALPYNVRQLLGLDKRPRMGIFVA